MGLVRLSLEGIKDIFLHSTEIENLFINEFLPDAPGEYVKVYLFGLMYAEYGQPFDPRKFAMRLGLTVDEVEEAWIYWETRGLVKRMPAPGGSDGVKNDIVFVSLVEELYGKMTDPHNEPADSAGAGEAVETAAEQAEQNDEEEVPLYVSIDDMEFDDVLTDKLIDKRLRGLYEKYQVTAGRTLSRQDTSKIEDAVKVYGIEPAIFDFAIDYCADLGKYSIDYIFKVALRWTEEGCRTIEDAKRLLEKHSRRNSWYRQVFKALGWSRLPAPADREIMDKWFDEMKCSIDEVLDACSAAAGIREPNLRYINKILENRILEKGGINTRAAAAEGAESGVDGSGQTSRVSRKVLSDYFEYIRAQGAAEQRAHIDEVALNVPGMKAVFDAESNVNAKLLSMKPGADNIDARQRLRAERVAIEERKKQLLTANGYPAEYVERKYRCDNCKDTGYTDEGMVCSCCKQRAEEAYSWYTNKEKA